MISRNDKFGGQGCPPYNVFTMTNKTKRREIATLATLVRNDDKSNDKSGAVVRTCSSEV